MPLTGKCSQRCARLELELPMIKAYFHCMSRAHLLPLHVAHSGRLFRPLRANVITHLLGAGPWSVLTTTPGGLMPLELAAHHRGRHQPNDAMSLLAQRQSTFVRSARDVTRAGREPVQLTGVGCLGNLLIHLA